MLDLLIIGAGPAGLLAAYTAAKKGAKTLVVDMKRDIHIARRACSAQFVLDEGYEGVPCETNGSEMSFIEIAYEMPPGTTAELIINWEEFYGKLRPGAYYIELWAKDKDGNPLRVDFVIT